MEKGRSMISTVKLVKRLVEFRPVSADVRNVNQCVDFLKNYLTKHGVYTRIEKLGERRILYAATRRKRTPSILFNTHLDVVPADESTFCFKEKNGWIWGRGVGDCLGNCAVVAQALIESREYSHAGVIFSTDEEISGDTTKTMIDKGYRGNVVIILDTTSKGYDLAVAQKGVLTVKLQASGKACHGATPWLGKNAFDRLIDGYLKIKALFPPVKQGDEWHTTLSANVVSAGTVFNRVPDHAEMLLDIRYTEATSSQKLIRKIRDVSGLKANIEAVYPVVYCDEHNVVLQELKQFMEKSLKHRIRVTRLNGATDARHFTILNVPIAMTGIPNKAPHAADERANIKGMLAFQTMLTNLCSQGLQSLA